MTHDIGSTDADIEVLKYFKTPIRKVAKDVSPGEPDEPYANPQKTILRNNRFIELN